MLSGVQVERNFYAYFPYSDVHSKWYVVYILWITHLTHESNLVGSQYAEKIITFQTTNQ